MLAQQGKRVGVVDADRQSPGIHVLFGFDTGSIDRCLHDDLHGESTITAVVDDITPVAAPVLVSGQILLIPASIKARDITRVLREGYELGLLNAGFQTLIDELALDGLHEETRLSITLSEVLLLVLAINKVPLLMAHDEVRTQVGSVSFPAAQCNFADAAAAGHQRMGPVQVRRRNRSELAAQRCPQGAHLDQIGQFLEDVSLAGQVRGAIAGASEHEFPVETGTFVLELVQVEGAAIADDGDDRTLGADQLGHRVPVGVGVGEVGDPVDALQAQPG